MESVKLKIREYYNQMSKVEKKISDLVLSDFGRILELTALDIAELSDVSSASVIRYVKKLGFDGLDSFKFALAADCSGKREEELVDPIISREDDLNMLCHKLDVLLSSSQQDFFYQLDQQQLQQSIDLVKKARRIYLIGIGASALPAYDLFHKLKRADFNASCYQDINMVVEFFNYIDERDVVIAFSYSGQSQEIVYACQQAKQQNANLIAITRKRESALQRLADICLYVPDREAVMRIGAFTSLHSSLIMADLIYLGVIQEDMEQIERELIKTRKLVEGLKTDK